jgi:hypothetical protein
MLQRPVAIIDDRFQAGTIPIADDATKLLGHARMARYPSLMTRLLAEPRFAADPGREAVGPGRLDQQPAGGAVAGLGEAAAFDTGATGVLPGTSLR